MTRRQKKTLIRIIFSAALTLFAVFIPADGIVKLLLFAAPYLLIGYDVLWGALRGIFRGQVFDEKFLMSLATLGAFFIGEYPEAAAVMIFYQVGELFQSIAVGKSRRSIAALMDIRPDFAVVLREGEEVTVSPDEVEVGETIVVRPGEKIPLDGVITKGATSLNTSALTGESVPAEKSAGERVISGSVNLSGVIYIKTENTYGESTVAKILELVENSAEKKAKAENFITHFSRIYTPAVVSAAALLALVPPLIFDGVWSEWINRALTFLVVSCPCALVVSVPLTFFGGIGGASRDGILIKGANYLEVLAKVDTVVLDKTGTLTEGVFTVTDINAVGIGRDILLELAAHAESFSTHPVGESIVRAYGKSIDKSRVGDVSELAGRGIRACVDGTLYYLGNASLMREAGAGITHKATSGTLVHIARDKEYLGFIALGDKIKKGAKEALPALRSLGVKKTVMLTGDARAVAEKVAAELSLDEIYSELLPADKVEKVEKLLEKSRALAFVGDGINDAPVLTRADIGIAMGALGSDAAIESADIVLMDDNIAKIPLAVRIARRTMRIVSQNILFSLAVKFGILLLTALGITGMWAAVFGDVGVLILATLNAMRAMIRIK